MRIFGGSLGIAASTAILRAKMDGIPAHVGKRDSQIPGTQSQFVKTTYAEAFRTDMQVATAISGLAVIITAVAVWQGRNRPRLPPQKREPIMQETQGTQETQEA